jgi:hypothetical protein
VSVDLLVILAASKAPSWDTWTVVGGASSRSSRRYRSNSFAHRPTAVRSPEVNLSGLITPCLRR